MFLYKNISSPMFISVSLDFSITNRSPFLYLSPISDVTIYNVFPFISLHLYSLKDNNNKINVAYNSN